MKNLELDSTARGISAPFWPTKPLSERFTIKFRRSSYCETGLKKYGRNRTFCWGTNDKNNERGSSRRYQTNYIHRVPKSKPQGRVRLTRLEEDWCRRTRLSRVPQPRGSRLSESLPRVTGDNVAMTSLLTTFYVLAIKSKLQRRRCRIGFIACR
jgi:hypothetical protein